MMNQAERNPVGQWLVMAVVVCCAFFVHNESIFVDIMESRNIITAREMVYDGNWLTPTMNGELRLEKPPLPTWIAAVVELVAPDSLALQRAMAGLAAVLLTVFLYRLAMLLTRDRLYAFVAVLLLCTSYSIVLMGRTASWDIYCHAFMVGAICYLFKALQAESCRWGCFTLAGLLMGLSFLGKGPVSFYALLLPFLCSYAIFYRKRMTGKWGGCVWMVALTLVLGSWWYAYIYIFHPEMTGQVLSKETSSWTNHNVRPWWYYWKFFLETGVWSLLTLFALLVPVWKRRLRESRPYCFALTWMLLSVFFLSLIPEKKSRYLLPVVIPAALTCAHLFAYWIGQMRQGDRTGRLLYRTNAALIGVVTCAIPVCLYLFMYREGRMELVAFVLLSLACLALGVWMFCACVQIRPLPFLLAVAGLMAVAELFMMPYVGRFVANPDKKSIALTRDVEALQPLPFYHDANEDMRIELVYAAYRKIRPLDLSDSARVCEAMPFVLVSKRAAEEVLPDCLKGRVELKPVDIFDDNPWPEGHRLHTKDFVNYVTVVQAGNEQDK